ncbi:hypothetical protein NDU88_005291 [Pleurodeles waltl]|uniref:Uncharacterized protein n=1 Tax=Pleurodeles waltl TaxID=8319 RepID=A0AAV7MXX4_PLEWA|nr:hypothetical protein NDU88_005291 [Pleurodeles waltl]
MRSGTLDSKRGPPGAKQTLQTRPGWKRSGREEGQTKEKKYFLSGGGVGVQEAEEEEPGSKDTSKEKKSSGKQV